MFKKCQNRSLKIVWQSFQKIVIYFSSDFLKFSSEVAKLDEKIKGKLSKSEDPEVFLVFRSVWGYFAKGYELQKFSM